LEESLATAVDLGQVRFLGHVPHQQLVANVYPGADALLILSSSETGPIVAWEAMAQGIPVVTSRYVGAGLEAAMQDEKTALMFEIGDVRGAASQLGRIWADAELRDSIARAGRKMVEDRYSLEASICAWDRALRLILERAQKGVAELEPFPRAGRLDRVIGRRRAEWLRSRARWRFSLAPDPGGEWPHSHSKEESDEAYWAWARAADRQAELSESTQLKRTQGDIN
jgi:hypothetical protein